MDLHLFAPKTAAFGPAEFLKAKLESEETPYDLKTRLDSAPGEVVVIDVRDPESFAKEHIRGSSNIPADEMVTQLARLPKDRTIVAYCWDMTCGMAPRAALELRQKGYRAKFLAGGIAEWRHKGYPVVRSEP